MYKIPSSVNSVSMVLDSQSRKDKCLRLEFDLNCTLTTGFDKTPRKITFEPGQDIQTLTLLIDAIVTHNILQLAHTYGHDGRYMRFYRTHLCHEWAKRVSEGALFQL